MLLVLSLVLLVLFLATLFVVLLLFVLFALLPDCSARCGATELLRVLCEQFSILYSVRYPYARTESERAVVKAQQASMSIAAT